MKKKSVVIIIIFIIVVSWAALTVVRNANLLQSQVLGNPSLNVAQPQDIETCQLLAEIAANDCLLQLAIRKKDDSICDSISKPSQQTTCQREVELTPSS